MKQINEILLERFGCNNPNCVFYSPFLAEKKICENCIFARSYERKEIPNVRV